ncbi:ABC transporter ATP-binding protein [Maribellus mangrovi]|uniref:ABC transporter ATP-binding protein n=1 Tax=Maribellus mangrovi TaxID=3133146 RepID=UPI0030EC5DB9
MKKNRLIIDSLHLIRRHQPARLVLIFLLTLIMGTVGGVSIVLLIPLLQLLTPGTESAPEGLAFYINQWAEKLHFNLSFESILLVFVVLLIVSALLQYTKSLLDASWQQSFIYQLRRRLFRKIIMADWTVLNQNSKTNHLQVLSKEVPNLANFVYFLLRLLTSLIMAAAYLAWAMLVSVKFTLIITLIGLVLFILLRRFLFKAFHLGEGYIESYNRLLKYIDDFWQTVKIAKVHRSEPFYYKKFDEASSTLVDIEYRMQKNYALPQLIYRIAGLLVLVGVVYVGFRFQMVPLASFFILIILFSRIYPRFTAMNTDVNMIITNIPSVELVINLDRQLEDHALHREETIKHIDLQKAISISALNFGYPGANRLFTDWNENIPAYRITGIMGSSGAGKTTFMDLIAGLQKPHSGTISVDGKKLNNDTLPGWQQSIGYLPQDAFFIDGTLRENLVWDSRKDFNDAAIMDMLGRVNAAHLVERFPNKLDEHLVNYHFHFSGGERQRLALARVLLRHPSLLLLDEATSSLDPENEQRIMETIAALKSTVTIIFVTHRRSLLPWFDHVIDLDKGATSHEL